MRDVGDERLQRVPLLQLLAHRLQCVRQLAHLAAAGLGQGRLALSGGHALRRAGQPLDGPGNRATDQNRQRRGGDGEHEREQRHLRRHVAHQLHHPEGCLANADDPASGDRRFRGNAGNPGMRLARLEDDVALAVEERYVGVDGAAGEGLQDGAQRVGRRPRSELRDGPRLVFGGAGGEERCAGGEAVDHDHREHGGQQQRGGSEGDEHLKSQREARPPRLHQARRGGADAEEEQNRKREQQLLPTHRADGTPPRAPSPAPARRRPPPPACGAGP